MNDNNQDRIEEMIRLVDLIDSLIGDCFHKEKIRKEMSSHLRDARVALKSPIFQRNLAPKKAKQAIKDTISKALDEISVYMDVCMSQLNYGGEVIEVLVRLRKLIKLI